ncbi:hypothetical protein BKA80DRAFT_253559 [Phyllosticta citrichinensis]
MATVAGKSGLIGWLFRLQSWSEENLPKRLAHYPKIAAAVGPLVTFPTWMCSRPLLVSRLRAEGVPRDVPALLTGGCRRNVFSAKMRRIEEFGTFEGSVGLLHSDLMESSSGKIQRGASRAAAYRKPSPGTVQPGAASQTDISFMHDGANSTGAESRQVRSNEWCPCSIAQVMLRNSPAPGCPTGSNLCHKLWIALRVLHCKPLELTDVGHLCRGRREVLSLEKASFWESIFEHG